MKNRIEDIVSTILGDYRPEVQYLAGAEILKADPLTVKGYFDVRNSVHLHGELDHLAISETALCVNQIERVVAACLVEDGFIEEWGEIDFCKWNPSLLGNEGLVIVYEEINFRKPIRPGEFEGIISMGDTSISRGGNYHVELAFNFADHAHYGKMRICFIPSMAERVDISSLQP